MVMECDELAVPTELWNRASTGDDAAKEELRKMFDGMVLYVHVLCLETDPNIAANYKLITTREFCSVMWDSVTLTIGFDGPGPVTPFAAVSPRRSAATETPR